MKRMRSLERGRRTRAAGEAHTVDLLPAPAVRCAAVIACFIASALLADAAAAAEMRDGTGRPGPIDTCSFHLSGEIERGDSETVAKKLQAVTAPVDNYPSPDLDEQFVICLSGPGGNYAEGIALARTFSRFDVTTKVEGGATCLSACAIAFLGGRYNTRSGQGWIASRALYPSSRLGFHAPQLVLGEGEFTRDQVLAAYTLALNAIVELNNNAEELFIHPGLVENVISHHGDNFYYIDTVDDLVHFNIRLLDHKINPIRDDTRKAACWNAFNWYILQNNARLSSDEWSNVFGGDDSGLLTSSDPNIYTFYPFDGPMYCKVSITEGGPLWPPVEVILSEFSDLSNPRGTFNASYLALFRGNRPISQTQ